MDAVDGRSNDSIATSNDNVSRSSRSTSNRQKKHLSSDYTSRRTRSSSIEEDIDKTRYRTPESAATRPDKHIQQNSWVEESLVSRNSSIPTGSMISDKPKINSRSRRSLSHDISVAARVSEKKQNKKRKPYNNQSQKSQLENEISQKDSTMDSMRNKLFSTFKSRGLLESMKGQLRSNLATAIRESAFLVETSRKPEEKSIISNIVDSLIAEHFKKAGYEYSLSVFQTESLSAKTKPNLHEILQFLNINPNTPVYEKMFRSIDQRSSGGILWSFLSTMLSDSNITKISVKTQTDDQLDTILVNNIEQKMKLVEQEINDKAMKEYFAESGTLESRFLEFKRKLDIEKKSQLDHELKSYKARELTNMQILMKEESRKEMEKLRKEMEKNYNEAFRRLETREKEIEQLLRTKEANLDQTAFKNRQKMLLDIEGLSQRENKMKQSHQIALKTVELEEERLKQLAEQLRTKEFTLKAAEERYESKLKEEILRMKLEQQEETQKKEDFFRSEEAKLLDEKRAFEYQKTTLVKFRDEHGKLKDEHAQLQASLHNALRKVESFTIKAENMQDKLRTMSDYDSIKQRSLVLEKELEILRNRVKDLQQDKEYSTRKHDKAIRELLEKLSRNMAPTKDSQKVVESERKQFLEQQVFLQDRCQSLENKLKSEIIKNQELNQRHKEKVLQQKEMFREIEELKLSVRKLQRNNQPQIIPFERERRGISSTTVAGDYGNIRQNRFPRYKEASPVIIAKSGINDKFQEEVHSDAHYANPLGNEFLKETKDVFERLEKEAIELERSYLNYQQKQKLQEQISDIRPSTNDFTSLMKHDSVTLVRDTEFKDKVRGNELLQFEPNMSNYSEPGYAVKANYVTTSTKDYKPEEFQKQLVRENASDILDKNNADTWNGDHLTEQLLASAINVGDEEFFHVSSQRRDDVAEKFTERADFANTVKVEAAASYQNTRTSTIDVFLKSDDNDEKKDVEHASAEENVPRSNDGFLVETKADMKDTDELNPVSSPRRKSLGNIIELDEPTSSAIPSETVKNSSTDIPLEKQEASFTQKNEDEIRKAEQRERILAFERERQELERLEREDHRKVHDEVLGEERRPSHDAQPDVPTNATEGVIDEEKGEKNEEDKEEEKMHPLMQHYMQLVLKKRQDEQEKSKEDLNLTDDVKLESKISGNSEASDLFEHDIENNDGVSEDEFEW